MGRQLLTPPSVEPVSVAEAKDHLRVRTTDDDAYIEGLIIAARELCEGWYAMKRAFITQTWKITRDDGFPCEREIRLPYPPLQAVTSVQYLDTYHVLQTMSTNDYTVDTVSEPGRIFLPYTKYWPVASPEPNAVIITQVVGYGDTPGKVPMGIRRAMLLLIGDWYANREETIVVMISNRIQYGVQALLGRYELASIA
jgi:uncharacterized phiE125 gp8 family phage protein